MPCRSVDVDADAPALRLAEAEQAQRLHQVEMRLARRHDAVGRLVHPVDVAIDRVGGREREDGMLLRLHPLFDLGARQIGPAIVQPAGRHVEFGQDETARRGQFDRGGRFDRLRHRLEADPHAGKARQGVAIFAEGEILLDRGRVERRHEPRHEGDVGLVRHG